MSKLTSAKRNALPSKTFVFPKERKFPIPDTSHARNALARAGAKGSAVKSKVRAAVKAKFPSIKQAKSMPLNRLENKLQ